MATVTISGTDYTVYADVATADAYLQAERQFSTSWAAATDDQKAASLVSATRYIDRQTWQSAYDTVAERQASQAFIDATCILAALVNLDTEALSASNTFNDKKRVKAGSVEVEYMRLPSSSATLMPTVVHALIGGYLASSQTYTSVYATGNTSTSSVSNDDFGLSGGY